MALLKFLLFTVNIALVSGLEITNFSVPKYALTGGIVEFHCDFKLEESENLVALKWLKNNKEIFRYQPQLIPHIFTFPADVLIDKLHSTLNKIILKKVASGTYTCQVLVDNGQKTLKTLSQESELFIVEEEYLKKFIEKLEHLNITQNFVKSFY